MKNKKKYSLRKLFNDIHLWLGIASGAVLFVVCLTGTIYTFRSEVEKLSSPEKYYSESESEAVAELDVIIDKAEAYSGGKAVAVTMPASPEENYEVTVKKSEKERRGTGYFVDPYTAEVKGSQGGKVSDFFLTIMKLHRWLLIEGGTGKIIVGVATIIFVFLILSGLVLWFPKKIKNIKQGLTIKKSASWKRVNHDLHNTLGFYSFILLLIMCLTGLCWSFQWYRDGLGTVMGAEVFKGRKEKPAKSLLTDSSKGPLSLSTVVDLSNSLFPYEGDLRISLPSGPEGSFSVYKSKTGFFALAGYDKAWLDQYTGKVVKSDRFSDKPLNEQIVSLVKPLHTGEVMGLFSKILYFIACLIATSLPVTGTIIWINKLNKKNRKKKGAKKMKSPGTKDIKAAVDA